LHARAARRYARARHRSSSPSPKERASCDRSCALPRPRHARRTPNRGLRPRRIPRDHTRVLLCRCRRPRVHQRVRDAPGPAEARCVLAPPPSGSRRLTLLACRRGADAYGIPDRHRPQGAGEGSRDRLGQVLGNGRCRVPHGRAPGPRPAVRVCCGEAVTAD
jgi:hypothetical protein